MVVEKGKMERWKDGMAVARPAPLSYVAPIDDVEVRKRAALSLLSALSMTSLPLRLPRASGRREAEYQPLHHEQDVELSLGGSAVQPLQRGSPEAILNTQVIKNYESNPSPCNDIVSPAGEVEVSYAAHMGSVYAAGYRDFSVLRHPCPLRRIVSAKWVRERGKTTRL